MRILYRTEAHVGPVMEGGMPLAWMPTFVLPGCEGRGAGALGC